MTEAELLVGGVGDADTGFGDVARLVGHDLEAERIGIDDDEAVAAIGGVDGERADAWHFELAVEPIGEARHIGDGDALGLAVLTVGDDFDEPARRLEGQPRLAARSSG